MRNQDRVRFSLTLMLMLGLDWDFRLQRLRGRRPTSRRRTAWLRSAESLR